jgi:hypothetical protein
MFLLFWLMYVDFSSVFVEFELYKASFDKYLLEFTSKTFVKKNEMLTLNFKRYEDQPFYIVTFVYWNIVYIESCMYKSVLEKINKLQKKYYNENELWHW